MFDVTTAFLLSSVLIFIFYIFIYEKRNKINLPGPSLFEIIKYAFNNLSKLDDFDGHIRYFQERYRNSFQIKIPILPPLVVTSDPKYCEGILKSKDHLSKSAIYQIFKTTMSSSIVMVETEIWKKDRKILNDCMRQDCFKVFLENLDRNLGELINDFSKKLDQYFDVQNIIRDFTMLTTVESIKDVDVVVDREKTRDYSKNSTQLLNVALIKMVFANLKIQPLFRFTKYHRMFEDASRKMREYAIELIEKHKEKLDRAEVPQNIIYAMLKNGFPYEKIVHNIILFLEAGHDTVSSAISYTLFEIAKRPDVQDKILKESNEILGSDDPDAPIGFADIQKMKYLECVVKESLRYHTVIIFIFRELETDLILNDKTLPDLPKGTTVVFSLSNMHLSDSYYEEPEKFDPDRFADKSNIAPGSYAPFSLGVRNCIGKPLAMQELKLVVSKLVRKFEFKPVVPEHKLIVRAPFASMSMNGIPVIMTLRKKCSYK